jgi:hypothetical protein
MYIFQVSSSQIFGGVLLQSPSVLDIDQREMFGLYLFPGNQQSRKVGLVLYNRWACSYICSFYCIFSHLIQSDRCSERI